MGGMRDAQSILDQMISFCGKTITQSDVLQVYGLASKDRITKLSQFVIQGDYNSIIEYTDAFSNEGLDFYRALLDLSDCFRELLLDTLRGEENANPTRQSSVRVLDALRQGEDLVKMGLSEKTNFEVTLFRAVEGGRSRSIDQVIRKISGMIPDEVKKPEFIEPQKKPAPKPVDESSTKNFHDPIKTEEIDDLKVEEEDPCTFDGLQDTEDGISDELPTNQESEILEKAEISEEPRQILDRKKIEEKIGALPDGVRKVLEEKFQAEFVS